MTGLIPEKQFSRRSFVKGGGFMLVGMSLAGGALAGKAQGAFEGKRSKTVNLKAGQWFFYPSFVGKKDYFIVTS